MKPFLYLLLLVLAACGAKPSSFKYGKATVADLVSQRGEPLEKQVIPVKNGEMFLYRNNEKYQIENNIVTYSLKNPQGDERSLLYWRHKFKDCDSKLNQISETTGHELPEYELKCSAEGITVVFTEGSDFISRVIEHEKK